MQSVSTRGQHTYEYIKAHIDFPSLCNVYKSKTTLSQLSTDCVSKLYSLDCCQKINNIKLTLICDKPQHTFKHVCKYVSSLYLCSMFFSLLVVQATVINILTCYEDSKQNIKSTSLYITPM